MTRIMAIYIGKDPNARRNLQHGLDTQTWGFPHDARGYDRQQAEYVLLATGHTHGGPRTKPQEWQEGTLDIVICQELGDFYDAKAPHWDDEFAAGRVLYSRRFGIIPLAQAQAYPVADLDPALAGQFKLSGNHSGYGKFVDANVLDLFRSAGLPAPQQLTISQTPGLPEPADEQKVRKARGAGYVQDADRRIETEQYAVRRARSDLEARGYHFVCELGKPYDLLFHTPAGEEVHVEVKGTTSAGEAVFLTSGEVVWHQANRRGMLVVISDITYNPRHPQGQRCSGGRLRLAENWVPQAQHLRPVQYTYAIPWDALSPQEVWLEPES